MSDRTVPVTAEWALHGSLPGGVAEYRLLACSKGDLGRDNFNEGLQRFSPGTLDQLPQVSVSYLPRGDDRGSYVALASHSRDARQHTSTTYFCVPYRDLAPNSITYQDLYEAFRVITLPAHGKDPLTVRLAVSPRREPAPDDLALQAAALLLTGPVCVLGADGTSAHDRLRFIDSVMMLLPYGMRSRMAAATWARATQRRHRFRLFFSNAPRATDHTDHVINWGHPELTEISPDNHCTLEYLKWLGDTPHKRVRRLADVTEPTGFSREQVLRMFETIGISKSTRADVLLLSCAEHIKTGNTPGLRSEIAALHTHTTAAPSVSEDDRQHFRQIIAASSMLSPEPRVKLDAKSRDAYYDALLRLAFGMPLTYAAYLQLEDCLAAEDPNVDPPQALLEAIQRGGVADPRVTVIVLWHLDKRRLDDWLHSELDVGELITMVAQECGHPPHARILCDTAQRHIRQMGGQHNQLTVRAVLRDRGYLAQLLQERYADSLEYQVETLFTFLHAAYGEHGLDKHAIAEVLTGDGDPPTPALLAAVLLHLTDRADAELARDTFVRSLFERSTLSASTLARLTKNLLMRDA